MLDKVQNFDYNTGTKFKKPNSIRVQCLQLRTRKGLTKPSLEKISLNRRKGKMTMEELMVKAIRQFRKENPKAEIRTCAVWESYGYKNKIEYASFHIEYVEDYGGQYKSKDIQVRRKSK